MKNENGSSNKINVGILLFPDVEVLDFAGPFEVFSRTRLTPGVESRRSEETAPFRVFTVAETTDPIFATGGLKLVPAYSFQDHPGIDLLIVPGGFGTRALLNEQETLQWIRKISSTSQLTTSVCTGSLLLATAGLLNGREVTTHWGAIELLKSIGREKDLGIHVIEDQRFVDSGEVITSAGVSAGMDMAFHIVERLCGKDVADETAKYIEYKR